MRRIAKEAFYGVQRRTARAVLSAKGARARAGKRIPVFNLHSLAPAKSEMAVSPERFREQLLALRAAGWRSVEFPVLLDALSTTARLRDAPFALTFDDGYRSVREAGLPILEECDMVATVFVTVEFVEKRITPPWGSHHPALAREYAGNAQHFQPLAWSELRELVESGRVRVGSHSLSHRLMGRLPPGEVDRELRESKKVIEDRLGVEVSWFSYPFGVERYGAYSAETERALQDAGYVASVTAEIGRAQRGRGPHLIPRLPLTDADEGRDALAKAAGAYDWVGLAQRCFQRVFPNPHSVGA
jgi:peptidoglycan/xylan/chitin deacetylase (PgdA/CDA1 family)